MDINEISKPMVSVLMPAFKAGYLENAIQSVLNQTVRNFELMIVNDKSPEDIDSVVDSFNDARIRYYKNKENIGKDDFVKNWNHCLFYATGEYVCFLCDDDEYSPLFFERMLGLLALVLVLLKSGTALLGLIVVFVFYIFHSLRNSKSFTSVIWVVFVLVAASAFVSYYVKSDLGEETMSRTDQLSLDSSTTGQSGFIRIYRGYLVF